MSRILRRKTYWVGGLIASAIFYATHNLAKSGALSGYFVLAGTLLATLIAGATLIYVVVTNDRRLKNTTPTHKTRK